MTTCVLDAMMLGTTCCAFVAMMHLLVVHLLCNSVLLSFCCSSFLLIKPSVLLVCVTQVVFSYQGITALILGIIIYNIIDSPELATYQIGCSIYSSKTTGNRSCGNRKNTPKSSSSFRQDQSLSRVPTCSYCCSNPPIVFYGCYLRSSYRFYHCQLEKE